ncbi:hypothetical protein W97_00946 [Coniosporium apollinis CBS 100218]|uniref:Uncharacterized protein n=1 Tax=Coniosporium apollinis (strain CBS 100218) TaxID=1168221 RepID=R7YIJ2_CONA1|nr:uncharacterized protein W97_00946 [Coniosporium apollinis CBS 100218]EON61730.1 hypothetical protein W97_00946 [Coniosporium apollinis CBS 100218]
MSSTRVLSATSLDIIAEYSSSNIATVHAGYRTVSTSSFATISSQETVEIPDELNSQEALEFCGFGEDTARLLVEHWEWLQTHGREGQHGFGDDIIIIARQHVKDRAILRDAWLEYQDWEGVLRYLGMSEEAVVGIMNPECRVVRLMASASEWVLDTIDMNFEFLTTLDKRIRKKRLEIERAYSPAPDVQPSPALRPNQPLTGGLHISHPSTIAADEVEPPIEVEGRTMLYKGGTYSRLLSIFRPDGSLNLTDIFSTPPTDFHPSHSLVYFGKQKEVADMYAIFAESRSSRVRDGAIMYVAIPNTWLDNAHSIFNPDWKQLVWLSRNRRAFLERLSASPTAIPEELVSYTTAPILLGAICCMSTNQIQRLDSADDIRDLRLSNGNKGTQVVLQTQDAFARFLRECQGYVWVQKWDSQLAYTYPPNSSA